MKPHGLHLALVHYPVVNRAGALASSSVTNLDLHDLARLSATYGIGACYIVTPLADQAAIVADLLAHWREGRATVVHEDRARALATLRLVPDIAAAVADIAERTGAAPALWATTAREENGMLSHREARRRLWEREGPTLLLLGTAWGLAPEVMASADAVIEPIRGACGYNHLSVRCAAAILVDRLLREDI